MIRVLFLFALLVSVTSNAESTAKRVLDPEKLLQNSKEVYHLPKLYKHDTDEVVQEKGTKLRPNRVYAVLVPEKNRWYFSLTSKNGNLREPLELLSPSTVISGAVLGAKNPYEWYKLTKDFKWVPTKEEEHYVLWVLSDPQKVKTITFTKPYIFKSEKQ